MYLKLQIGLKVSGATYFYKPFIQPQPVPCCNELYVAFRDDFNNTKSISKNILKFLEHSVKNVNLIRLRCQKPIIMKHKQVV